MVVAGKTNLQLENVGRVERSFRGLGLHLEVGVDFYVERARFIWHAVAGSSSSAFRAACRCAGCHWLLCGQCSILSRYLGGCKKQAEEGDRGLHGGRRYAYRYAMRSSANGMFACLGLRRSVSSFVDLFHESPRASLCSDCSLTGDLCPVVALSCLRKRCSRTVKTVRQCRARAWMLKEIR